MSNRLEYIKEPNLLINLIKSKLNQYQSDVVRIYIIGSLAQQDFLMNSDVDLLIITESREIINQIRKTLDEILVDQGICYDLIHFTLDEFNKRSDTILIKEAIREGIEL